MRIRPPKDMPIILPGQKYCIECKQVKDISEFFKDKYKPDGLRQYCKDCNFNRKKRNDRTKKHNEIMKTGESLIDNLISDENKLEKTESKDPSLTQMANLILKQYKDDLKRSDETYDFFFNRLNSGDNTEASKLALLKSLELRMSSADMIAKLMQLAAKFEEVKNKAPKSNGINLENIRNNFKL